MQCSMLGSFMNFPQKAYMLDWPSKQVKLPPLCSKLSRQSPDGILWRVVSLLIPSVELLQGRATDRVQRKEGNQSSEFGLQGLGM